MKTPGKIKLSAPVLACITAALFSACVSLQNDISINNSKDQTDANLAKIETAIVPLEAVGGTEARRRQSEISSARQMIAGMEREASADADFSGKLIAWSGRLAILEGRYSEAQRLYRQSVAVSPGNISSVILGIRLEGDPSKRLEIIERELSAAGQRAVGVGELNIERGRSLLELNRFSEAAGAFDTAFSSGLAAVYIDSYGTDRNRAWELRNAAGVASGTLNMLGRESISWNDCITIAKNETQLLRFITGGRNLTDAELFNRLLERAFIPVIQDISVNEWPGTRPNAGDVVTRAGAAWFVWHLYAEARADRSLLTRYSSRYATGANPRSPITDVPPLSPFFDSILGCVETEFLSLPDGRNFRPSQPIRGTELLSILRRIDN
jgi:tetratricopeptide (TPR) repeat protein